MSWYLYDLKKNEYKNHKWTTNLTQLFFESLFKVSGTYVLTLSDVMKRWGTMNASAAAEYTVFALWSQPTHARGRSAVWLVDRWGPPRALQIKELQHWGVTNNNGVIHAGSISFKS